MHADFESPEELRQEILELLRRQMDALDSPSLSDEQLRQCYLRQARVQQLREKLQAATGCGDVVSNPA